MPRKNLIRTDQFPYHVTIRTNNKEWFDLPVKEVWEICLQGIHTANLKYPAKIQAFVLMGNHYHLMIWTPNCNLDKFMFVLNSFISKKIRKLTDRENRVFGDRYRWSIVDSEKYYNTVLKYIYQNPVRAELSKSCESYPYSSLYYHIRSYGLGFALYRPIIEDTLSFLMWINQVYEQREASLLSKAIRKPYFRLPRKESSRRII